jgi:hypothetical protein
MADDDNQPGLSPEDMYSLLEVLNRPPALPTHEPIPTSSYRSFSDWLKDKFGYVPQEGKQEQPSHNLSGGDVALLGGLGLAALTIAPRFNPKSMMRQVYSETGQRNPGIAGRVEQGYNMHDATTGEHVGGLNVMYDPRAKDIYVAGIDSIKPPVIDRMSTPGLANHLSQSLGYSDVKSLIGALKNEFPEAETISGWRTSGARLLSPGEGNEDATR